MSHHNDTSGLVMSICGKPLSPGSRKRISFGPSPYRGSLSPVFLGLAGLGQGPLDWGGGSHLGEGQARGGKLVPAGDSWDSSPWPYKET